MVKKRQGRSYTLPVLKDRGCVYKDCKSFEKPGSIVRAGISGTSGKNQYFRCRHCKRGFSSTHGTMFANKKKTPDEIVRVLHSLAEGQGIRGSSRVFKYSKDTVLAWLKEAGSHAEQVERQLVQQFNFNQVQIDELWTFILKKTTLPLVQKNTLRKRQPA